MEPRTFAQIFQDESATRPIEPEEWTTYALHSSLDMAGLFRRRDWSRYDPENPATWARLDAAADVGPAFVAVSGEWYNLEPRMEFHPDGPPAHEWLIDKIRMSLNICTRASQNSKLGIRANNFRVLASSFQALQLVFTCEACVAGRSVEIQGRSSEFVAVPGAEHRGEAMMTRLKKLMGYGAGAGSVTFARFFNCLQAQYLDLMLRAPDAAGLPARFLTESEVKYWLVDACTDDITSHNLGRVMSGYVTQALFEKWRGLAGRFLAWLRDQKLARVLWDQGYVSLVMAPRDLAPGQGRLVVCVGVHPGTGTASGAHSAQKSWLVLESPGHTHHLSEFEHQNLEQFFAYSVDSGRTTELANISPGCPPLRITDI